DELRTGLAATNERLDQVADELRTGLAATQEEIRVVAFELSLVKKELRQDREIQRGIIETLDRRFVEMTERLVTHLRQITDEEIRHQWSVPRRKLERIEKEVEELKARDAQKERRISALEARKPA
ncbi:MAG: hypothetical protein D6812_00305, partial [Deltaproteobacteria bacterium]